MGVGLNVEVRGAKKNADMSSIVLISPDMLLYLIYSKHFYSQSSKLTITQLWKFTSPQLKKSKIWGHITEMKKKWKRKKKKKDRKQG